MNIDILIEEDEKKGDNQLVLISNTLNTLHYFMDNTNKFKLNLENPDSYLSKSHQLKDIGCIIQNLEEYPQLNENDYERICEYFHYIYEKKRFKVTMELYQQYYINILNYKLNKRKSNNEKEDIFGSFMNKKAIESSIESYINYINSPTIVKKRSYIFHTLHPNKKWINEEYKNFLEGLNKYFDLTINNKKIAKHMGNHIKPNHVRYVKGKYLRKLRKRAKESQVSMKKLLQIDIASKDIKDLF